MKNKLIKYRKPLLLLAISLICAPVNLAVSAQTAIYQKTEANGKMSFSDTPTPDATLFKLKAANLYSSISSTQDQPAANAEKQNTATAQNRYQKFSLIQPAAQQDFHNQQEILAVVQIDPVLQSGDNIEWWLDGKLYQQNTSTQTTLHALDRGEHTLQAKLLDAKNHILLTTQRVIFYAHYAVVTE